MFEWLHYLTGTGMTAYVSHPLCYAHEPGKGHPESPQRLLAVHRRLEETKLLDFVQEVEAEEATDVQLSRVHAPRYLDRLENAAPGQGNLKLDEETIMNPDTMRAVRLAAGAVVKAVDSVMKGRAANAFCAVRPPGHHAESAKSGGFCFVNNVAVGAMHAIAEYRLRRVLIVDFDVHHGNGTEEIFRDDPRVMLLSLFEQSLFPFCKEPFRGSNPGIIRIPLPSGTDGKSYRAVFAKECLPRIAAFNPELIMLSAGFDAHADDDMSHCLLHENDYVWLSKHLLRRAQLHCRGKLVSVLEGGYNPTVLASCVAAHIKVLAGA